MQAQQIHDLKDEYIRRNQTSYHNGWRKVRESRFIQHEPKPDPNRRINRNHSPRMNYPAAELTGYPSESSSVNHSPPQLAARHSGSRIEPGEDFKIVGRDLKLDQSTITPNKEHLANQKLEDLANKSDQVLLKVSTVWPFTFFVHDIIIDPYKVTIIFREFFWSEQVHSIMIRDVLDIVVETSIFFATVKIVDQGYTENTVDITYLKKSDALSVRKIIQGLVIAHRQSVDLSIMKASDIKDKTEELGKVKGFDD